LNIAPTTRAPPVGRPWTVLGGGIFNRYYGEFSTGVDTPDGSAPFSAISCRSRTEGVIEEWLQRALASINV
jgi:hypothetical protein